MIEVTRGMPGALAGMVLAHAGAEVLKAESLTPDPYLTEPGVHLWNRGKSRVQVDLDNTGDRAQARRPSTKLHPARAITG